MNEQDKTGAAPGERLGEKAGEKSSEELRAEIARTRERLVEDVEAIGTKLSPANVTREAKEAITRTAQRGAENVRETVKHGAETVRESVSQVSTSITGTIRANPVPVALIGMGVGWLLLNRRNGGRQMAMRRDRPSMRRFGRAEWSSDESEMGHREQSLSSGMSERTHRLGERLEEGAHRLGERVEERAHELTDRARHGAQSLSQTARERASDVRERASMLRDRARDRAARAGEGARHMMEDNPLAVGALALATGVGVGMLLPKSPAEDRLMGDLRERFVERVKEKAHDASDLASEVGRRAAEVAREEAERRNLIPGQQH